METPSRPVGHTVESTDRGPEELSVSECFELLRGSEIGRLAVQLPDGGVDIFPVNFAIDHDTVLLRTAAGTKLDSIENDPQVAFEADHFDWYDRSAWSVVVKGVASMVRNHDELFELFNVELDTWHPERKPFFVRLVPTSTTGRRFRINRRVGS